MAAARTAAQASSRATAVASALVAEMATAKDYANLLFHLAKSQDRKAPAVFREDQAALEKRPRYTPGDAEDVEDQEKPVFLSAVQDAVLKKQRKAGARVVDLFNRADRARKGKLDSNGFLAFLLTLVPGATDDELLYALSMIELDADGNVTLKAFKTALKESQSAEIAAASGGVVDEKLRTVAVERGLRNLSRGLQRSELGQSLFRRELSYIEFAVLIRMLCPKADYAQDRRIALCILEAACSSNDTSVLRNRADGVSTALGGCSVEGLYFAVRIHNKGTEADEQKVKAPKAPVSSHKMPPSPEKVQRASTNDAKRNAAAKDSSMPKNPWVRVTKKLATFIKAAGAFTDSGELLARLPTSKFELSIDLDDEHIVDDWASAVESANWTIASILTIAEGEFNHEEARAVVQYRPEYHRVAMRDIMRHVPHMFGALEGLFTNDERLRTNYMAWMRESDIDGDGKLMHSENLAYLRKVIPHCSAHDLVYLHTMMDIGGNGHVQISEERAHMHACMLAERAVSRGGVGRTGVRVPEIQAALGELLEKLRGSSDGRVVSKALFSLLEIGLLVRKLVPNASDQHDRVMLAMAEALSLSECSEQEERGNRVLVKGTSIEALHDALQQYNINNRLIDHTDEMADELTRAEARQITALAKRIRSLTEEHEHAQQVKRRNAIQESHEKLKSFSRNVQSRFDEMYDHIMKDHDAEAMEMHAEEGTDHAGDEEDVRHDTLSTALALQQHSSRYLVVRKSNEGDPGGLKSAYSDTLMGKISKKMGKISHKMGKISHKMGKMAGLPLGMLEGMTGRRR